MNLKNIFKWLLKPLTPINKIIPKNKKRILFYSNLGFRDNTRAMYDFMIKHGYNKKYEIICSLDDYEKYKNNAPENVRFVSNLKGLALFFRSKYMFFSFGKYPIKPASSQQVINLWHGMPLKTVGNLEKGCEKNDYYFFSYTIATSEMFRDIMSKVFSCPADKILLTGQPRCDCLFEQPKTNEKIIIWMPTYRASDRLSSYEADFNSTLPFPIIENLNQLKEIDDILLNKGYKMIIKPHPLQNVSKIEEKFNCISIKTQADLENEGKDLYDLFPSSSALITDYSSVYFDYLLLDKPIGFTIDDFDKYNNSRGFVVNDPKSLMPGEKIKNFDDFKSFIIGICSGEDSFADERARVSALTNSHQKGDASIKILNHIGL